MTRRLNFQKIKTAIIHPMRVFDLKLALLAPPVGSDVRRGRGGGIPSPRLTERGRRPDVTQVKFLFALSRDTSNTNSTLLSVKTL